MLVFSTRVAICQRPAMNRPQPKPTTRTISPGLKVKLFLYNIETLVIALVLVLFRKALFLFLSLRFVGVDSDVVRNRLIAPLKSFWKATGNRDGAKSVQTTFVRDARETRRARFYFLVTLLLAPLAPLVGSTV